MYNHYLFLISIISLFTMSNPLIAVGLTNVTGYHPSPGLADPGIVARYEVFELPLVKPVDYGQQGNFFDVDISAVFTGPVSGTDTTISGFYYDTLADGTSLWKIRFAPTEVGTWSYRYTFTHTPTGDHTLATGSFECISGTNKGFLRKNPANSFRWEFENGQPFCPIGMNDCLEVNDTMQLDGGDRYGAFRGVGRTDDYFQAYAEAGFNMFRFSQNNCSPDLANYSLTAYDKDVAMHFDFLMQQLRNHDFRIFYGLFGYLLPDNAPTPPPAEVLRFVEYCVDRWGAYVDVWQLQNERTTSDNWINTVAAHLRAYDPYGHYITTSWERPELAVIEISAPHWYQHESELESDLVTANKADNWKTYGKPVVVGEQGNSVPYGELGNWLPDSALRMRLRCWTAFFKEISILFWNISYATNGSGGGAANIYLGHEERQYIHVLQWFSNFIIRNDTTVANVTVSNSTLMRAYGLTSSDGVALFIHHYADHTNTVSGQTATVSIPAAGQGYWINPATGQLLSTVAVSAGSNILTIPDFVIDIAFFSTSALPADTPPIAIIVIDNPQADGDLDDDGKADYGPQVLPFGIPPLTLTLNGGSSYDLDGGAVSYLWQFGDGSPDATTANVVHTYAAGNFLTTLTVTDDEGKKAGHTIAVRATGDPNPNSNNAPTFNKLRDMTVREGELVVITPRAIDQELIGSDYNGDTISYSVQGMPAGATFGVKGADWSKQFWWVPSLSQSGTYPLEFQAQDDEGASPAPQSITITVLDAPEIDPAPPIIADVSPDIEYILTGAEYVKQLVLVQGYPAPTWSLLQGHPNAHVDGNGRVSDWTPDFGDVGELLTFEIQATNSEDSDTETWQVRVRSMADFDGDDDVDQEDFGRFQACYSGAGIQHATGCEDANLEGNDNDVDLSDFILFQPCMNGPNNPPGC